MAHVDVLGFTLSFRDNESRSARIYANGLNQVPVQVSVRLVTPAQVDPQDPTKTLPAQPYTLTREQLARKIRLYAGEEPVPDVRTPRGLQQQTTDSGYANALYPSAAGAPEAGGAPADPEWQHLTLYVSASGEGTESYRIFAELDLSEENADDDPSDQFIRTNGEGSWDAQLDIATLPPVNYSQSDKWVPDTTSSSSSWVGKGSVSIDTKQKAWVGDYDHNSDSADSRYRRVYISIAPAVREQNPTLKLLKRTITGDLVVTDGKSDVELRGQPGAYFGWGYDTPHYDVIAWWVEPGLEGRHTPGYNDVGFVDGSRCYLQAFNHYYRIKLDGENVYTPVDTLRDDAITLYQWDIRYANTDISQWDWSDSTHDATVSVTDNFGNSGTFRISFPTDAWDPVLHFDTEA